MKHTATPWEIYAPNETGTVWITGRYGSPTVCEIPDFATNQRADAEHIVRAVNLHSELVEALENFLRCQAPDGTKCAPDDRDFEQGKAVIAKARTE